MTSVSIIGFGCIQLLLGAWAIWSTVDLSGQAGVRATGWIVGVGIPLAQMICIVAVLWHAWQLAQSRDKNVHVWRLLILLCISFLFIVATLAIWWASEQWNVGEPQHWLVVDVNRLPPNELLGRLGSATISILFPLLLCAALTVIELILGVRLWFNRSSLE